MTLSTILILAATHAIAFVGGALLFRNNETKIDAAVTAAKSAGAAVQGAEKAAATAVKTAEKV